MTFLTVLAVLAVAAWAWFADRWLRRHITDKEF